MMASHTDFTLEEKFVELQKTEQPPLNRRPKIRRVAEHLRNREKIKEHYSPKLVSIGPIHHGNTNLKLGEKYKLTWAKQYIGNAKLNPQNLYKKIADNIGELKSRFVDDVLTSTSIGESQEGFASLDEKLSWILFVDGCSLLHVLEIADFNNPLLMLIKFDQLGIVIMDVLLLENQLPYLVLKLLWKNESETELISTMKNFLKRCDQWSAPENKRIWRPHIQKKAKDQHTVVILPKECELPTHLLDLQRTIILTEHSSKTKGDLGHKSSSSKDSIETMTYRNIQDLRAIAIQVKSSATRRLTDINFSDGWFAAKLILPKIVVDETTAATFLNLIAYEMCPDFENDYGVSSFIAFMNSLIDNSKDVRELRREGILHHWLCSDEEVVNLFNLISKDLVDNFEIYLDIRDKMHKHSCSKYKTWILEAIDTYDTYPGRSIAFLGAIVALSLSVIQTWFAIYPAKK